MSKQKANARIDNRVATPHKGNHTFLLVLIPSVVVICILAGVILNLLNGKESKVYNSVVTPDNVEEVIEQQREEDYTPIGSYEVNMNSDWTFPDGASASTNAYVGNSTSNQNTVFFTIALTDDERQIYESPLIPPGSHMEDIKLDEDLSAGTYDAVLTYHLVDEENQEISTVAVSITITIEQ
jgi:hypothetical protein